MMGLSNLFAAIKRLAAALNRSAELFETANGHLEQRLAIDPHIDEDAATVPAAVESNGHARRIGRVKATN